MHQKNQLYIVLLVSMKCMTGSTVLIGEGKAEKNLLSFDKLITDLLFSNMSFLLRMVAAFATAHKFC